MNRATTQRTWENDRVLLDQAYSPGLYVPDLAYHLDEYAARSALARRTLRWEEISYGPSYAEALHFFPAVAGSTSAARSSAGHAPRAPYSAHPGTPLLIFIHGGYWRDPSRWESSFAAAEFVRAGAAFAALGYGPAPEFRLDDIVAQVRRGVLWLYRHAAELGVDPGQIFLAGASAGAQLAAMCLVDDWLPITLRVRDVIRGVCLVSGVYELETLRHSYLGEAFGLTAAEAARNSPLRHVFRAANRAHRAHQPGAGLPPLVLASGDRETVPSPPSTNGTRPHCARRART
ncbi:alpha/beta hydrolase [Frankia sp. R43]|uniref:alpha/beta hydrolase n=1 Tax=Frankia sp. R43 TaxID=269536 RepID=UPI0006CA145B|nr:alpha/beta hydrolase [Frankia sp. R43]